ncbi:MAG: oxygen-dependent coproporphyrinogen oxidase [Phycisphaerales bacterium]|nr:oxygen-dependent coproporphyrinogen oxidase [Phycisphaerales bacterium]
MTTPIIQKNEFTDHLVALQKKICTALEEVDGVAVFRHDDWTRGTEGGGGHTRVLSNGKVFEKAGVNISKINGVITSAMKDMLHIQGDSFFATGLSIVIHPYNPFVPTVHANFRFFEAYDTNNQIVDQWFAGGTDLTPYYLFEEDAIHFHTTLKNCCDGYAHQWYPLFKKQCDEYFVNKHRQNEARGIGGVFYDYLRGSQAYPINYWQDFTIANSLSFLPSYLPIVHRRKETPFDSKHKFWQEIRRGRYIEFNLIHDRGTTFGLKTNGRTESILMSLPPTARFVYDYQPEPHSPESQLHELCLHPRNWLGV